ncbi:MAG: AgmX/PglI C-terminal domain-containing protein [Myxococcota bacterium]
MFCQSCGAKNVDDARFCNMCGGRIASAGSPGGPVGSDEGPAGAAPDAGPPAPRSVPQPGTNTTSITLSRIGVQSPRRMWAIAAAVALALVGLGALGMWLVTGEEAPEPAHTGNAQPEDPFMIGAPLPKGAETPEEDFLSGEAGDEEDEPEAPSGAKRARAPAGGPSVAGGRAGGPARGVASGEREPPSPEGGPPGAEQDETDDRTGDPAEPAADPGEPSTPSGGEDGVAGAPEDPAPPGRGADEISEERDVAMDQYGSRVRYVVRRYYAERAQRCFDRATRNEPGVSGTVVVGLAIGADGEVTRASVGRNTTGDSELGDCLAGQVRTWKLPPPPEGALEMDMPFSR